MLSDIMIAHKAAIIAYASLYHVDATDELKFIMKL